MKRRDLVKLHADLKERMVLSVYVDSRISAPSDRSAWRTRLSNGLEAARSELDSTAESAQSALERAAAHLTHAIPETDVLSRTPGWMAFATEERLEHSGPVHAPVSDSVRWQRGAMVSPSVRALKSEQPVVLVLADARKGRVFRYRHGELAEDVGLVADAFVGDTAEVGVGKRASRSTGVRGATGRDTARRALRRETDKLLDRLAETVLAQAGAGGSVVLGGIPEVTTALLTRMPPSLQSRALEVGELHLKMSNAQLLDAAREWVSKLSERRQAELVESVVEGEGNRPRSVSGWNETLRALEAGAVQTLLVSRRLMTEKPDDAELLVRLVFDRGGDAEDVGGPGGEKLDQDAGGVAAILRFVPETVAR